MPHDSGVRSGDNGRGNEHIDTLDRDNDVDNGVNSGDCGVRDDGRVSPHALRSDGRVGANITDGGVDIPGRGAHGAGRGAGDAGRGARVTSRGTSGASHGNFGSGRGVNGTGRRTNSADEHARRTLRRM